MEALLK